jgi:Mor family transcriptional regulator
MPLPSSLIDIAETLGLRVALRLMQAFGGQELRFPKNPGPDHPVIKALGEEDGRALCMFIGGDLLYIPHGRARRTAADDIRALEAKGHSRAEIAKVLGISQRHVRRAANAPAKDSRQRDLFSDV